MFTTAVSEIVDTSYISVSFLQRVASRKFLPAQLHTGPAPSLPLLHLQRRQRMGQGPQPAHPSSQASSSLPTPDAPLAECPTGEASASDLDPADSSTSSRGSVPVAAGPQLPLRWRRLQTLEQKVVSSYGKVHELLNGAKEDGGAEAQTGAKEALGRPRKKHHLSRCTTPRDFEAVVQCSSPTNAIQIDQVSAVPCITSPSPVHAGVSTVSAPVALPAANCGEALNVDAAVVAIPAARPSFAQPAAALIRALIAGGCSAFRANNLARLHIARGTCPEASDLLRSLDPRQQQQQQPYRRR